MQHLFSTQDLLNNTLTGGMWLFLVLAYLIQQTTNSEESFRNHLNPQGFMTIPEIIQYWGYSSEEYEALTDDGYYLQLNRIPYGKHYHQNAEPRPIVLLVHGFMSEGRCWIANLPSNSLGFFLADAGYDVWMINNRGTTWSRRHKEFSIDQQEFWEFSFHETAIYDIPATIDFILQKTKQDSLYYIGHSQGAAMGFIAFAILPYLSDRVKLFISLTPPYNLEGMSGTMSILGRIPDGLRELWEDAKDNRDILIASWVKISEGGSCAKDSEREKNMKIYACSYPVIDQLCLQSIFLAGGYNEKNLNVSRADVYVGIFPDYSSVKTMNHWSQILISAEFKYYDYGNKNIEVYNMTTPPFYKIEDVSVPVAVWSGGKDISTTPRNIKALLPRIPHLVFYKDIPDWTHVDPALGLDAPQRFYPDVLKLMQKYKD